MFDWFKTKKPKPDTEGLVSTVMNAVTSALSWRDVYGMMKREQNFNTIDRGLTLSAVYCDLNL